MARAKYRGRIVNMRVTDAEHRRLKRLAAKEGLSLSDWLRRKIFAEDDG